jgi:hypothetical protein
MPILHDCVQYSDEYDRLRLGLPTSSNFHKIITPGGVPSKQWQDYACHLLAERVLERKVDTYTSRPMERGLIVEAEAAEWYELDSDQVTQKIGFVTTDDGKVGCSPDRLVGEDGLLELKCPLPQTQMEYWITGEVDDRFRPQLQGQLYITGRKWVDIVCWCEELPKVVMRVEPDEKYIEKLARELDIFNHFIERIMERLREGGEIAVPKSRVTAKAELRDKVRASLEAQP